MKIQKKHLFDAVIAAVFLIIGISSFFIINALKKDGAFVRVTVNGKEEALYSLSSDGEYPLCDGKNTLVIEDGRAYIKSADCPDKLCVKYGKISKCGERIVCLPNKLMAEIVGEDEEILVP